MTKRKVLLTALYLVISTVFAQLKPGDKVFLTFKNIEGEVNVDGFDACNMLREYIVDMSFLIDVDSIQKSDYTFILSVFEKNMGYRRGKIDIVNTKTQELIFESKWTKGSVNMYYGSSTKHAIAMIFKKQILKTYPEIEKEKEKKSSK